MTSRGIWPFLLSLPGVLTLWSVASASYTFEVKPYYIQPGFSIDGGFITVSALGVITTSSFEAFEIDFTADTLPYTASSSDPDDYLLGPLGSVDYYPLLATRTSLHFTNPFPFDLSRAVLLRGEDETHPGDRKFSWLVGSGGVLVTTSEAPGASASGWTPWSVGDTFVIATREGASVIPEPSAIFVWSGLFLGFVGYGWRRRRSSV